MSEIPREPRHQYYGQSRQHIINKSLHTDTEEKYRELEHSSGFLRRLSKLKVKYLNLYCRTYYYTFNIVELISQITFII